MILPSRCTASARTGWRFRGGSSRPPLAFVIEHGDGQGEAVRVLLQDGTRWASVSTRQDLTGRDRFAVATRA